MDNFTPPNPNSGINTTNLISDFIARPGQDFASSARIFGELLADDLATNRDFYFFSPDETSSNKLDAVYKTSSRLWQRPIRDWELHLAPTGQIIEMLSENTLFAVHVGHNLAGGQGLMTSYEAFFPIISSQLDQYLKFIDQARQISWRTPTPSLNLLSTSTCWRQDHNGFSHQNPSLISNLLIKPSQLANCFFPIDATATFATHEYINQSTNSVNLVTLNKTDEPQWIDIHHARFQLDNGGASIFQFASDDQPDIIITATGDIVSREALYAIQIAKLQVPELKLRFVGITTLSYNAIGTIDRQFSPEQFDDHFTPDKPIIANFHGYPDTLRNILSHYAPHRDLDVHGYIEQGSTTTPFDMLARNHADRYNLAISIFTTAHKQGIITDERLAELTAIYEAKLRANAEYIKQFGIDQEEITSWKWRN